MLLTGQMVLSICDFSFSFTFIPLLPGRDEGVRFRGKSTYKCKREFAQNFCLRQRADFPSPPPPPPPNHQYCTTARMQPTKFCIFHWCKMSKLMGNPEFMGFRYTTQSNPEMKNRMKSLLLGSLRFYSLLFRFLLCRSFLFFS